MISITSNISFAETRIEWHPGSYLSSKLSTIVSPCCLTSPAADVIKTGKAEWTSVSPGALSQNRNLNINVTARKLIILQLYSETENRD